MLHFMLEGHPKARKHEKRQIPNYIKYEDQFTSSAWSREESFVPQAADELESSP